MTLGKIIFLPKPPINMNIFGKDQSFVIYPIKTHTDFWGPGVYEWFFIDDNSNEIRIYVGKSDLDTYLRGISEAFRLTFSSDTQGTHYQKLDTDYVVGTVIKTLSLNYNKICYWRHVDEDPTKESSYLVNHSILQSRNTNIDSIWKIKKDKINYWRFRTKDKIKESEDEISAVLKNKIHLLGTFSQDS